MGEEIRRVASNEIMIDGKILRQYVVEIIDHKVVNFYSFQDELPLTEWFGGQIELRKNPDGFLQAFFNNKIL